MNRRFRDFEDSWGVLLALDELEHTLYRCCARVTEDFLRALFQLKKGFQGFNGFQRAFEPLPVILRSGPVRRASCAQSVDPSVDWPSRPTDATCAPHSAGSSLPPRTEKS